MKRYSVVGYIGRSNVGQMSAQMAIDLDRAFESINVRCLPAVSGNASPAQDKFKEDDGIIVINGCKLRCLSKTLGNAGLGDKIVKEYTLDIDFDVDKTPGLDYDREVYNILLEKIKQDLEVLTKKDEEVQCYG